jgi:hypothetical protein
VSRTSTARSESGNGTGSPDIFANGKTAIEGRLDTGRRIGGIRPTDGAIHLTDRASLVGETRVARDDHQAGDLRQIGDNVFADAVGEVFLLDVRLAGILACAQYLKALSAAPAIASGLPRRLQRLFHYQSYNRDHLENTIKRRLIRFSRATGFNDPWDCKPSFYVPEEKDQLERLVQFMYAASKKHTPEMDPVALEAHTKHYLENPAQLRADLNAGSAEMWEQMGRRYRIYCLSARPDSQLMWGHYADHHRGVCLEFNVRTRDFSSATEVRYNATYPEYRLDDNTDLSPFFTKSSDWAYEMEYRLVAQEESEAFGSRTLMTRDDGMFQFSEGALVSVIIGSSAADITKPEIEELARGTGVLIRAAMRVPHRYELTFDPARNARRVPGSLSPGGHRRPSREKSRT